MYTENKHLSGTHRPGLLKPLALGLLIGPVASFSITAATYQVIDLGIGVSPRSLNNNGTVVGSLIDNQAATVAFRYSPATGIEQLDGLVSNAVNDSEQIAGNTLTGAFFYSDGLLKDIGDDDKANGINVVGLAAGNNAKTNPYRASPLPRDPAIYDSNRNKWSVIDVANVYSRGTRKGVYADVYDLADINDAGYAVGKKYRTGLVGSAAIMTTPAFDQVIFLSTPYGGYASAINNLNIIVGATGNNSTAGAYSTAFHYDLDNDVLSDLGTLPGGLRSAALDINELNQVVGFSETDAGTHAFIWENGQMQDLNDQVSADSGWLLSSAVAINNAGDIAGTGTLNGQTHGFLMTTGQAAPQAPVAMAGADITSGKVPLTVNFSATGSYDPDGNINNYEWNFGDGSPTSTGISATHIYTSSGNYVATLTVTDNDGLTSTAQVEVNVRKGGGKNK